MAGNGLHPACSFDIEGDESGMQQSGPKFRSIQDLEVALRGGLLGPGEIRWGPGSRDPSMNSDASPLNHSSALELFSMGCYYDTAPIRHPDWAVRFADQPAVFRQS